MTITATIFGRDMAPLMTDFVGNDDDGPMEEAEGFAQALASCGMACCVRWHRSGDGQVAYWSPRGCQLEPHWYGLETRGGAGRGQGRKAADGKSGDRLNVNLDAESAAILRSYGDGNLSLGVRRAALLVEREVGIRDENDLVAHHQSEI